MRFGLQAAFRIASMVKELREIEHPKAQDSLWMRAARVPAAGPRSLIRIPRLGRT